MNAANREAADLAEFGSYPNDNGPAVTGTVTAVAPSTAVAGSGSVTLAVTGTGFDEQSVIHAGGQALATTVVSDTRVTAPFTVPATAGTVTVTVFAASGSATFTVTAAAEG